MSNVSFINLKTLSFWYSITLLSLTFTTQVTVTDNGAPPRSTIARVIVKILDENDNRPQFLQKFYKIRLPEREKADGDRSTKREPLYRVIATDKDEGPNAEISYSIEEGNEHGRFSIEPKTGVVSSKKFSAAGEYDILSVSPVPSFSVEKVALVLSPDRQTDVWGVQVYFLTSSYPNKYGHETPIPVSQQ